jgi:hypothetical protein
MTQAKDIPQSIDDEDMLPEYDFSKMGQPIRGKHARKIREKGYSVTVHHEDGTSTTTYVTPEDIARRDDLRSVEDHRRDPLVNQSAEA